jgi:hypothetical protein
VSRAASETFLPTEALQRAVTISRELLTHADNGDVALTQRLDAERLQLLKSVKTSGRRLGAGDWQLLEEIAALNDRALGFLEHRRRRKARDLDMVAAGKRALRAYSATGR